MVAERIKDFETRREQLVGLANGFYNLTLSLLLKEGKSVQLERQYSYLWPAEGEPQGGGLDLVQGMNEFTFLVVTALLPEGTAGVHFLLGTLSDREGLSMLPRDFEGDPFKDFVGRDSHSFELFMQSDIIDPSILFNEEAPVCKFQFGGEKDDQELSVFGKSLLVNGDYRSFITQEMLSEFGDVVLSLQAVGNSRDLLFEPTDPMSA